jgi:putative ABC transport system permease protein
MSKRTKKTRIVNAIRRNAAATSKMVEESIMRDVQYAVRTLLKTPGFTVVALVALVLGIGANTAIFSVVSGVLLRPLPFAHPDRLVQLNESDPRNGVGVVTYSDLQDFRKQSTSLETLIVYGNTSKNLQDVSDPERIATTWAERGFFRMLGVEPIAGRTFRDDDPPNVVVLSAGFWKRRFGGDPALIGKKITLDGEGFTAIGVMPDGFQFPYRASQTELWIPWVVPPRYEHNRSYRVDSVAGRLKAGVSVDASRTELHVIAKRLEAQYPDTNRGRDARVTPLSEIVAGSVRAPLLILLGAVGLVLLIACANVANLLLARAAGRTHEVALRSAIGATRGRLVRQFLTESLLLAVAGGLGGLLLAVWGTALLVKLAVWQIPRSGEIGLDWRVFLFLLVVSVGAGVGFGLVPALTASRVNVYSALKDKTRQGSAGRSRLRDGLVVTEIALAFVLLMGAGLMLRTFLHLVSTPTGMVADNVLTLHMTISSPQLSAGAAYGRYVQQLEERIGQIPGVRAAGFIQYLPLQNWGWTGFFSIPGRPVAAVAQPRAELRYVSPGYFRAMGIPIRSGRGFTDGDTADTTRVILINEALARRYFQNENPIGRQTDRGTIAGVVGDVHEAGLGHPALPEIYYAFAQNTAASSDPGVSLVVSTRIPPESVVSDVRKAIHQVNPAQAIFNVKTMQRVIAESLADLKLYLWLLGLFAALALALAVAGVYGVISYTVTARIHEFGIRVALGADSGKVLGLVLWHGGVLVAVGLVLGVAGALGLTRLLKSLLFGVTPTDPATFVIVSIVLALVALTACLVPARRAMRVDPMVALRYE